jgi:hypothetical protein
MDTVQNLSSGTRIVTLRMTGCLPLFLRMTMTQGARKIHPDMVNDGYGGRWIRPVGRIASIRNVTQC